jgi:site-specific recombinase XerD
LHRKPGSQSLPLGRLRQISEAIALEIDAIDRANLTLRIIGKGNKERRVPLPQPVLAELGRMWKTHRNRRWLFPIAPAPGLSATTCWPALSPQPPASPASSGRSRRTCCATARMVSLSNHATRLIENGINPRTVQVLLGHQSIASTAIYTHLTEPIRAKLRTLLDELMTGL